MTATNNAKLAGLRILMAEDEMAVALSLETLLEIHGCHAVKVARVDDALSLAQSESFDGALLDVNLAGNWAYPVAATLAERGVPFIFITGYSAAQIEAPWRDRPVLEKPFPPEQIEHIMRATFVGE